VFDAVHRDGEPHAHDDETQDVGWFAPDEIDVLEMADATRATLRSLLGGSSFVAATWQPPE
jgi:hypothetical protein